MVLCFENLCYACVLFACCDCTSRNNILHHTHLDHTHLVWAVTSCWKVCNPVHELKQCNWPESFAFLYRSYITTGTKLNSLIPRPCCLYGCEAKTWTNVPRLLCNVVLTHCHVSLSKDLVYNSLQPLCTGLCNRLGILHTILGYYMHFQSISKFILSMISCNLSSGAVHALCSVCNVANL